MHAREVKKNHGRCPSLGEQVLEFLGKGVRSFLEKGVMRCPEISVLGRNQNLSFTHQGHQGHSDGGVFRMKK